MRTTVKIRRGALIMAAAMACAAVGTPTAGVNLVDLITGVLPGAQAASAYPFNPWALPVHPPVPGDLPQPPPFTPTDPPPIPPGTPTETYPIPITVGGTGSAYGIPSNVLAAYRRAADLMAARDPGCHLTWPVLAGIGRIESNHASGGNLRADGTTKTRIIGIALDGRPGVATIRDSDNGALDGDSVWDRAVGPMQFLPGTWEVFGQDGNGDGRRDPHNMYDAAVAAAVYLCQGDRDLRVESNLRAALFAYNPSTSYVNTVLAWIRAYERGGIPVAPTTSGGPNPTPSPSSPNSGNTDHTAPSTPANLRSTEHTETTVDLTWNAATDNVGVVAYEIYRGSTLIGTATGTSYRATGLVKDTTYTFTVRARDAAGNRSQASAAVNVVTDIGSPAAPTNLRVANRTSTSVQLTWAAATDNVAVVAYDVLQGESRLAAVTGTSHTITGLTPDTVYTFAVRARDASGNVSVPATITVSTDVTAPAAPAGLVITSRTTDTMDLAWIATTDNVGVVSYEVRRGTTVVTTVAGTTARVPVAAAGADDAITVHAIDAAGNGSEPAIVVVAADGAAPSAPTNVQLTAIGTDSAQLVWDAVAGAAEYVVLQDGKPVLVVNGTTAQVNGLAPETTFAVVARDAAGHVSALSADACFQCAPSGSPSPSDEPSPGDSSSPTDSSTPTQSPTPTSSPSPTDSPTPTVTTSTEPAREESTATASEEPDPTPEPEPTPTETATSTETTTSTTEATSTDTATTTETATTEATPTTEGTG